MEIEQSHRLVEEARLVNVDGGATIQGVRGPLPLKGGAPQALAQRLTAWTTEDELGQSFDLPVVYYVLNVLRRHGLLRTRFQTGSNLLFGLSPAPDRTPVFQGGPVCLSRFAYLRQDHAEARLESPLSPCRVTIHDPQLAAFVFELCSSVSRELGAAERLLAGVLSSVGMLDSADTSSDSLPVWEFHDLLFHGRTSPGFHPYPYGGTFPHEENRPAQPVVKSWPETMDVLPLPSPSDDLQSKLQTPFVEVLNRRQSVREPATRSVNVSDIGAFLHESARLKRVLDNPGYHCAASLRPYPSGGALHSLEVYFFAHRCEGLKEGIYHYDPQAHAVRPLPISPEDLAGLRAVCPFPDMGWGLPDVTFYVSSRFERTAWKYESIAYRLVQQDLGCLYQTMYLVATALDLAPCALGVAQCALLAKVLGIDSYSEPFIGAFTLSAR